MALLLAFGLVPHVVSSHSVRVAIGDLVPLLVLTAIVVITFRNAWDSHGHTRLFWALMTVGMAMWWLNQSGWVWFELIVRKPLPDPYYGDVILFLHLVPFMAAVAFRPHPAEKDDWMLPGALNILMLLIWWVVVYAFVVFPDEYLVTNPAVYSFRWDVLYLMEGLILVGASGWAFITSFGSWRRLYFSIWLASAVYTFSSQAISAAISQGIYVSGGLDDVGFLAALLVFFWAARAGRRSLRQTQIEPALASSRATVVPHLAQLALLSLPLMGYWALFHSASPLYLRQARFAVAMGGLAVLAFVVFLKQHLLDGKLVQLLRATRDSYDNLQRLQGRVVQQAKLASLGELVALAAGELQYPLATVLTSSEGLAASNSLSREQLANAQKIGQQARRTRDLVTDLLSFAQQAPGDKSPLDLKPLLQRTVQMEAFKLDSRAIQLSVQGDDGLPRVLGNSNQLLQAFLQIVENAVDALQEVGGGRLLISLIREADELVVKFADSGPGLQHPERVFDPFYTTKPVGKGTGLGLSATYGVIQDHHGQISCYNAPEGGAVFEIRLPVPKAAPALEPASIA